MISILCHVTCYEQSLIRCSPDQPTVPQTFLLTNFQFLPVFLSSLFLSLRVMLGTPGVIFHETHNVCTLRMHNNAATHLTHGAHRCRDSAMGIKMICTLTFSKKSRLRPFHGLSRYKEKIDLARGAFALLRLIPFCVAVWRSCSRYMPFRRSVLRYMLVR